VNINHRSIAKSKLEGGISGYKYYYRYPYWQKRYPHKGSKMQTCERTIRTQTHRHPKKKEKEKTDYSRNAWCTIHYVIPLHFRVSDPYEEYLVYSDATNVDPVLISYYHYNVFDGC
jgi:hypothetical protein